MNAVRLFTIANIPVWVSPWYFILLVWIGFNSGVEMALIWGGALGFSVLVHEFGHALMAKRFGQRPEILLHGLGGQTTGAQGSNDKQQALILAAGPGAGLVLGFIFLALKFTLTGPRTPPPLLGFVEAMIWLNIFWSIVNLLPMWPLDGGQLFRLGMIRLTKPVRAEKITHGVSLVVLAFSAWIAGAVMHLGMLAYLIAGWLAYQNIMGFMGRVNAGPVQVESKAARALLGEAEEAYAEGDWREASRLAHLIREEKNVADKVLRRTWAILGVSSARLGEEEHALHFLARAPVSAETVEARIECLYRLHRDEDLEELLRSPDFEKIPPARREEILEVVR